MSKKKIIVIIVICLIISVSLVVGVIIPRLSKKEIINNIEEKTIKKEIKINVKVKEDINLPFNSDVKISDMIEEINGKIINDKKINTIVLGEKEISFDYINEDNIKVNYKFKVNVFDDVKPLVWLNDTYVVDTNYDGDLVKDIMCADNETSKPNCFIEGDYDTKSVGSYKLTYVAQDRSNNETRKNFTLKVKEPSTNTNRVNDSIINYSDVVKRYKNNNTKIGIDVSGYQGLIDFEAVKNAGVEFVFIKAGGEKGLDQEFYVDSKFLRNIEGFNNVGIPVGVYVYSYATSEEQAKKEALWVLDQIKDYKVELPIVYDWENWSRFNYFEMSLYEATKAAEVFVDTINSHGYEGSLYGSKNYLEKVWLSTPGVTWLAHYNDSTSYQGDYRFWQRCDNGRIDGIVGNVDIDIWYLDR